MIPGKCGTSRAKGGKSRDQRIRKDWSETFFMSKTILLLEENDDGVTILEDRLRHWGYRVSVAQNEEDALHTLKTDSVTGIIFELNIRGPEGLMALSDFHQRYPQIPILAMSDETRRMSLIGALEQGASDYIIKPVDFDLLRAKCQRLFE